MFQFSGLPVKSAGRHGAEAGCRPFSSILPSPWWFVTVKASLSEAVCRGDRRRVQGAEHRQRRNRLRATGRCGRFGCGRPLDRWHRIVSRLMIPKRLMETGIFFKNAIRLAKPASKGTDNKLKYNTLAALDVWKPCLLARRFSARSKADPHRAEDDRKTRNRPCRRFDCYGFACGDLVLSTDGHRPSIAGSTVSLPVNRSIPMAYTVTCSNLG
jgi:hypothetical protein